MTKLEELQGIFKDSAFGRVLVCESDTPESLLKRGIINQETYDKLLLASKQYERVGSEYRVKSS